MYNLLALKDLASKIRLWEKECKDFSLMIYDRENRDMIKEQLIAGLSPNITMKVDIGSTEYANQIAALTSSDNKYVFSLDKEQIYLSQINHYACRIASGANGGMVYHLDTPGIIYDVTAILAKEQLNISSIYVSREQRGKQALLVFITDEQVQSDTMKRISELNYVTRVLEIKGEDHEI